MKFKLTCAQDPKKLGIESADGKSWDISKFAEHIKECSICKQFANALQNDLQKNFNGEGGEEKI